jgi:acyl-CoA thioesterase
VDKEKIKKYFFNDRYARLSKIEIVDVKEGYCKVKMDIEDMHLNALNILHGGAIFTLADFAFAVASNSRGRTAVSINASITYFKPPKGKIVFAETEEINLGNKLATYQIKVFDDLGTKVALFTGTVFRTNQEIKF